LIINLFNEGLYYRSSLSMTELKKKTFLLELTVC